VTTLGISLSGTACSDGACICAMRFARRTGRFTATGVLFAASVSVVASFQHTVAHLGELDEQGRVEARALARRLIGTPEEAQLFSDGSEQLTVPVRLKGIRVERSPLFWRCAPCACAVARNGA
jgi:hypothetical protein